LFHRGFAPMALHNAPIRRIVSLLPLGGVPAPLQTTPVVWNFKIPYNKKGHPDDALLTSSVKPNF